MSSCGIEHCLQQNVRWVLFKRIKKEKEKGLVANLSEYHCGPKKKALLKIISVPNVCNGNLRMVGCKSVGFFDHMKPVEADLEKKMLKELKKIAKSFNGLHCSWIKCLYIH